MLKPRIVLLMIALTIFCNQSQSQYVQASKEEIIALTPDWKGERFPDGRYYQKNETCYN